MNFTFLFLQDCLGLIFVKNTLQLTKEMRHKNNLNYKNESPGNYLGYVYPANVPLDEEENNVYPKNTETASTYQGNDGGRGGFSNTAKNAAHNFHPTADEIERKLYVHTLISIFGNSRIVSDNESDKEGAEKKYYQRHSKHSDRRHKKA